MQMGYIYLHGSHALCKLSEKQMAEKIYERLSEIGWTGNVCYCCWTEERNERGKGEKDLAAVHSCGLWTVQGKNHTLFSAPNNWRQNKVM